MSVETNRQHNSTASPDDVPDPEEEKRRAAAAARVANRLSELRLVLLGWRWPGKSLTGNTILGREEFRLERAAEFCVKRQTELEGRRVVVVDTPGWYSNQDTPPAYRAEIARGAAMCPPGPHAFLLVVPVGMFTDVDRARIEEHVVALFGERAWRHTLVVFTWSEMLRSVSIERYIRREGRELQWVLDKCGRRFFLIDNNVFGQHPQLGRLLEAVEKMVAEVGGIYRPEEVGGEAAQRDASAPLDENQNRCAEAAPAAGRELGARPKQNSAARLATMEQDVACN